ncbi:ATP-dependent DNA helicase RecQ [Rubripirellula lacrimiformis]|uniref:ATP-dependent DNA helicase RecQ n=1 Tax=Rubripirellula lacrimiformis TaxID=1930273 RepID=A0A517N6F8_9BACT|nr:RecQ family ATP-dependent DNA helicase [Rubripirellula lacrimiformis]QDT02712.1 ATP-dependent DNA helicase RecQ [Rubripirellula lacrimiformis]
MADTSDPTALLGRFGLTSFRPGQREVVDAVASGKDVMCVMPTGGGKSLCYQLPSLARSGTTIVVSPLIALMKDQVDALQNLGIAARLINSTLSASQQTDVMNEMAAGKLDLVYVAPERLRNSRFLEATESAGITLLAIDEAHCVSEWGHDFRPDYSRLGRFRRRYLNNVQTIALTATATPLVRDDVIEILGLDHPQTFVTGFARTNLRFSVSPAKTDQEKNDTLLAYLQSQTGSGIIYAATRKRCEELADWLPEKVRRPIGVYHAGLDPGQRRKVQDDFMSGKLSAIVATNAFGMGIDKSDIRYVVHYNMPGSLEAYYQEAGRAGRDGLNSECRLLFSYSDRYIQEFFIDNRYPSKETVRKVYEFLLTREEDPIELTLDQVREAIDVKDGSESIGTAQTLLAKSGVLRRLDPNANYAMLRIDSDAPSMLDYLPKEAKIRRKVMLAIEKIVGRRRHEDVFVRPARLQEMADVKKDQLTRTLRELRRLKAFDYVPPFRGRAVHFTDRDRSFDELQIDFAELAQRKAAETEKLESVIQFARTSGCRQRVILSYFGETEADNCGTCDRCAPNDGSVGRGSDVSLTIAMKGVDPVSLLRGIRVVLSGVTRMHGRFGKILVAQMLCGSKSKKLQQWRLNRLSTYGLLSELKQSEVVAVMDALTESGLLEQKEVDERRPTIHMTEAGKQVMLGNAPLPPSVRLSPPLAKRLSRASREIESGDVQTESAGTDSESTTPDADAAPPDASEATTAEVLETLKRWRRKTAAALGIPAFRVLTNSTMQRVAQASPRNSAQLENIAGVGSATIEQFGYDLIQLISTALDEIEGSPCVELESPSLDGDQDGGSKDSDAAPATSAAAISAQATSAAATPSPADPPPVPESAGSATSDSVPATTGAGTPATPTAPSGIIAADTPDASPTSGAESAQLADAPDVGDAYWTWRLFRDGYSAHQVAEIRRCDKEAVINDLVKAALTGHTVDPNWADSPQGSQRIRRAVSSDTIVG